MRRLAVVLVGLVALLALACGGDDDEGDRQPTPAAALSPPATPGSPLARLPCQMPDDIKSFRLTVNTKMDMPGPELEEALEEVREALKAGEQGVEDDPFAKLEMMGEGWGPLLFLFLAFADMRVEGAFVAPDRIEVRAMYLGVQEFSGIGIGDKDWVKRGASGWEESTGELADDFSFMTDLCEGSTLPEGSGLEAREETVNGVPTYHYHLEEADLRRLAELFAGDAEEMWDAEDLLQGGTVDVWLAKEGNWPVRVEGKLTLAYGEVRDLSLSVFAEVKDLNDPSIKIEPPAR